MAAITFNLNEGARALIDDWVREGRYASIEEVMEAGIHFVREQVEADGWKPSAKDIAAIKEGRADIAGGRYRDMDEVFDELEDRFRPR